jgi:hypothetical protein
MDEQNLRCDEALFNQRIELLTGQRGKFIEQYLTRASIGLPEWFAPSATHVAVVTDRVLYWINVVSPRGYSRSHHWTGLTSSNERIKHLPEGALIVRRYGDFWSVERELRSVNAHEVLGLDIGFTPILHRNYKAAMTLAKRCHPVAPQASPLSWLASAGYLVEHPSITAKRNAAAMGDCHVTHG